MIRRLSLLEACVAISLAAAPSVTKVEPPNWWAGHTRNPIQILITGAGLGSATVSAESKGFRLETRSTSPNGHYLFAYLTIDRSVKPGEYGFQVKSASGAASFDLVLDKPLDSKGHFQRFSPDDVIYLIMPDRFSNGDPR
jgi:hypothetical protein